MSEYNVTKRMSISLPFGAATVPILLKVLNAQSSNWRPYLNADGQAAGEIQSGSNFGKDSSSSTVFREKIAAAKKQEMSTRHSTPAPAASGVPTECDKKRKTLQTVMSTPNDQEKYAILESATRNSANQNPTREAKETTWQ